MDKAETGPSDHRQPAIFSRLVEHAIEVSSQWHDHTYRKSRWRSPAFVVPAGKTLGVPVMAHVTAVAVTVQRAGWDDVTVAAAFLHDVVEDRNTWGDHLSFENLTTLLGSDVAEIVRYVSEPKFDEQGRPIPWRVRKEAYVSVLREAPPGAIAISLADKLHNLWSINEGLAAGMDVFTDGEERKGLGAGPKEQEWFFAAVIAASMNSKDRRLDGIRDELQSELARFRALTSLNVDATR